MMSLTLATSAQAIPFEGDIGLGIGGAAVAVALIILLSSKELISSSSLDSPKVRSSLNLAIVPLLAVFVLDIICLLAV